MINIRQQEILKTIIKEYVDTAQPVSSGVLVKKYNLKTSPATFRAEMKKLEEEEYLFQPHTSAGRVPTYKGYRFFINSLMRKKELTFREQKILQQKFLENKEIYQLMPRIAELLADMSSNLVIGGTLGPDESEFYSSSFEEKCRFYKAGVGRLLREPEFGYGDSWQIAEILDYLDKNIKRLFDVIQDKTIEIYIGEENPIRQMRGLSVIISGQKLGPKSKRLVAILGPRRMRYDRNIALIEYINKLLEQL